MTPPYKAHHEQSLGEDVLAALRGQNPAALGIILSQKAHMLALLDVMMRDERTAKLFDARKMLARMGREDDLLNVYQDLDEARGVIRTTWTFSDRDTALLFRLSLL